MMYHKNGFTLIELLLSLFVFSLIMISLDFSYQHYNRLNSKIIQKKSTDWYQFKNILRMELKQYEIIEVINDKIIIEDNETNNRYYIHLKNQCIYKTPGFHPYLYEVNMFRVYEFDTGLWVLIEFTNGEIYEDWIFFQ